MSTPDVATKLFQEVRDAFDELASIHAETLEIQREMNLARGNGEERSALVQNFRELHRQWDLVFAKYLDAQTRFTAEMRTLKF